MPVTFSIDINWVVDSHNYIRIGPIGRINAPSVSITSVTAIISSTSRGSAISTSNITLSVTSEDTASYEGDFPNTVTTVIDTEYFVILTVVANSKTAKPERKFTARGQ